MMAVGLAGRRTIALCCAVLLPAMTLGTVVAHPLGANLAFAAATAILLAGVAFRAPHRTLYVLAAWLVALGSLRRLTTGTGGRSLAADPLLAVGPLLFVVLGALALRAGALRDRTALTLSAAGLIGVLSLSALNPAQGAIVGLTGMAVVIAPMFAFFVGRRLIVEREIGSVLMFVAALAVPTATYGLFQVLVGFPAWDQRWIDERGYNALNIGNDVIRPFASFASGQEFGTYVAVAIVVVVAFFDGLRRVIAAPVVALLSTAVWYESTRTVLVLLVVALALMAMSRARLSLPRAMLAGIALLTALPWAVGHLAPSRFGDDAAGTVSARNIEGLVDPLAQDSNLHGHVNGLVRGVRTGFSEPLGRGVGTVTSGAASLGGASSGTESDPGNAAVAAGLPGLILYLGVMATGFTRAYRLAAETRLPLATAALGILTVTFLHWLSGGLYSVTWLPWLALGWIDRASRSADYPASTRRREGALV